VKALDIIHQLSYWCGANATLKPYKYPDKKITPRIDNMNVIVYDGKERTINSIDLQDDNTIIIFLRGIK
jgi:hypothetical protein